MDRSAAAPATELVESYVDRIYDQVKAMALAYELKPGERINESVLSKQLNVSRTPLREALNRLRMEGFLEVRAGKGFFRCALDPQEVFDLYQLRAAVEAAGLRLAMAKATDANIEQLVAILDQSGEGQERTMQQLVGLDEAFHETLMRLSGNAEMLRVLQNVNARISFVRWIEMGRRARGVVQGEHREIAEALRSRDVERCVTLLETHISRQMDEITAAIRESYSRIYMGESPRNPDA